MNKKDLIDFEKRVQEVYESGKIKAPVHLSGNNEDQLIEIFKKIDKDDWVLVAGEVITTLSCMGLIQTNYSI